ncbi:MAG: hypothetical protein IJM45_09515 [Clostridia bacterium]|nr:hypothetical protein [Clostridia bacterium]
MSLDYFASGSYSANVNEKRQISIPYSLKPDLICQILANPDKNGEVRYKDAVSLTFIAKGCIGVYPKDLLEKKFRDAIDSREAKIAEYKNRRTEEELVFDALEAQVGSEDEAAACDKRIKALNKQIGRLSAEIKNLKKRLRNVKTVSVEPNGRMVLDAELAAKAGIGPGAVRVIGQGQYLEIWDTDAYEAEFPEDDDYSVSDETFR